MRPSVPTFVSGLSDFDAYPSCSAKYSCSTKKYSFAAFCDSASFICGQNTTGFGLNLHFSEFCFFVEDLFSSKFFERTLFSSNGDQATGARDFDCELTCFWFYGYCALRFFGFFFFVLFDQGESDFTFFLFNGHSMFYASDHSRAFSKFRFGKLKVFWSSFELCAARCESFTLDDEPVVSEFLRLFFAFLAFDVNSTFRAFCALPRVSKHGRRKERKHCADRACEHK